MRLVIDREVAQQLGDFGLLELGRRSMGTHRIDAVSRRRRPRRRKSLAGDGRSPDVTDYGRRAPHDGTDTRFSRRHCTVRLTTRVHVDDGVGPIVVGPIDAKTGRLKGEPVAITDEGMRVGGSDLSPDGTKLLYEVQRTGQQERELWSADLVSGRSQPLYGDLLFRGAPRWAPDSRRAIYFRVGPPDTITPPPMEVVVGGPGVDERMIMRFKPAAAMQPEFVPLDWSSDGRSVVGCEMVNGTVFDCRAPYRSTRRQARRAGPNSFTTAGTTSGRCATRQTDDGCRSSTCR